MSSLQNFPFPDLGGGMKIEVDSLSSKVQDDAIDSFVILVTSAKYKGELEEVNGIMESYKDRLISALQLNLEEEAAKANAEIEQALAVTETDQPVADLSDVVEKEDDSNDSNHDEAQEEDVAEGTGGQENGDEIAQTDKDEGEGEEKEDVEEGEGDDVNMDNPNQENVEVNAPTGDEEENVNKAEETEVKAEASESRAVTARKTKAAVENVAEQEKMSGFVVQFLSRDDLLKSTAPSLSNSDDALAEAVRLGQAFESIITNVEGTVDGTRRLYVMADILHSSAEVDAFCKNGGKLDAVVEVTVSHVMSVDTAGNEANGEKKKDEESIIQTEEGVENDEILEREDEVGVEEEKNEDDENEKMEEEEEKKQNMEEGEEEEENMEEGEEREEENREEGEEREEEKEETNQDVEEVNKEDEASLERKAAIEAAETALEAARVELESSKAAVEATNMENNADEDTENENIEALKNALKTAEIAFSQRKAELEALLSSVNKEPSSNANEPNDTSSIVEEESESETESESEEELPSRVSKIDDSQDLLSESRLVAQFKQAAEDAMVNCIPVGESPIQQLFFTELCIAQGATAAEINEKLTKDSPLFNANGLYLRSSFLPVVSSAYDSKMLWSSLFHDAASNTVTIPSVPRTVPVPPKPKAKGKKSAAFEMQMAEFEKAEAMNAEAMLWDMEINGLLTAYTDMMDDVSEELQTVPLVLHCMLDALAGNTRPPTRAARYADGSAANDEESEKQPVPLHIDYGDVSALAMRTHTDGLPCELVDGVRSVLRHLPADVLQSSTNWTPLPEAQKGTLLTAFRNYIENAGGDEALDISDVERIRIVMEFEGIIQRVEQEKGSVDLSTHRWWEPLTSSVLSQRICARIMDGQALYPRYYKEVDLLLILAHQVPVQPAPEGLESRGTGISSRVKTDEVNLESMQVISKLHNNDDAGEGTAEEKGDSEASNNVECTPNINTNENVTEVTEDNNKNESTEVDNNEEGKEKFSEVNRVDPLVPIEEHVWSPFTSVDFNPSMLLWQSGAVSLQEKVDQCNAEPTLYGLQNKDNFRVSSTKKKEFYNFNPSLLLPLVEETLLYPILGARFVSKRTRAGNKELQLTVSNNFLIMRRPFGKLAESALQKEKTAIQPVESEPEVETVKTDEIIDEDDSQVDVVADTKNAVNEDADNVLNKEKERKRLKREKRRRKRERRKRKNTFKSELVANLQGLRVSVFDKNARPSARFRVPEAADPSKIDTSVTNYSLRKKKKRKKKYPRKLDVEYLTVSGLVVKQSVKDLSVTQWLPQSLVKKSGERARRIFRSGTVIKYLVGGTVVIFFATGETMVKKLNEYGDLQARLDSAKITLADVEGKLKELKKGKDEKLSKKEKNEKRELELHLTAAKRSVQRLSEDMEEVDWRFAFTDGQRQLMYSNGEKPKELKEIAVRVQFDADVQGEVSMRNDETGRLVQASYPSGKRLTSFGDGTTIMTDDKTGDIIVRSPNHATVKFSPDGSTISLPDGCVIRGALDFTEFNETIDEEGDEGLGRKTLLPSESDSEDNVNETVDNGDGEDEGKEDDQKMKEEEEKKDDKDDFLYPLGAIRIEACDGVVASIALSTGIFRWEKPSWPFSGGFTFNLLAGWFEGASGLRVAQDGDVLVAPVSGTPEDMRPRLPPRLFVVKQPGSQDKCESWQVHGDEDMKLFADQTSKEGWFHKTGTKLPENTVGGTPHVFIRQVPRFIVPPWEDGLPSLPSILRVIKAERDTSRRSKKTICVCRQIMEHSGITTFHRFWVADQLEGFTRWERERLLSGDHTDKITLSKEDKKQAQTLQKRIGKVRQEKIEALQREEKKRQAELEKRATIERRKRERAERAKKREEAKQAEARELERIAEEERNRAEPPPSPRTPRNKETMRTFHNSSVGLQLQQKWKGQIDSSSSEEEEDSMTLEENDSYVRGVRDLRKLRTT
eukprot:g642.t1